MGRNIVICSDGTGNTFDGSRTNVTRLVQSLALDTSRQVAAYDQGVGTATRRVREVDAHRRGAAAASALEMLPGPPGARWSPRTWINRGRGLLNGHGLEGNVREMYRYLAREYAGPSDRVFLFGFSRGAFTVRALAGLLYRCRLPAQGAPDVDARFERAWALFEPIHEDPAAVAALLDGQRPCDVHFLGLWDTVKSYGGLNPVMLPHLRHNPIVANVRHALALDERRAWFKATTWGLLDRDEKGAMKRLHDADRPRYAEQSIAEVWFTGCHSDIGGGESEEATARIALRWMLGEAVDVAPPLELNPEGEALLAEGDPPGPPQIHESSSRSWRAVEAVPRKEIDNDGEYPRTVAARGSAGPRDPTDVVRGGTYTVHATVPGGASLPGRPRIVGTKGPPG